MNFYIVLYLEGQNHLIIRLDSQLLQLATYSSELKSTKTKAKFHSWHAGEA